MREQPCGYLEGEFPERGTTNAKALRQGCLAYVQCSKEPSLPGARWGRERVLGNEIMAVAVPDHGEPCEDFGSHSALVGKSLESEQRMT